MDYDQKIINYNDFLREIDSTADYGQYPMGPPSPNSAPMGFLDTPAFDNSNFQQNNNAFDFNLSSPAVLSSSQVPIFLQPKHEPNSGMQGVFNFSSSGSPYSTPLTSNPSSPMMVTDAHPLHGFGDSISHSQYNVETPEGIKVVAQPKKYQVVNYNIYPALEIEFEKTSVEPITIQAFLVYDNSIEVPEGFTNGDVQVLKIGQNRVSFPALHLNRMTPIKNTVQQSGAAPGANFSIKFKIGNTFFFSNPFKLVSAVNQIPNEEANEPMRPRKSKSEKGGKDHVEVLQPKASKVSSASGKRRATDQLVHEDDLFLHVKVRGDEQPRGFITLPKVATLRNARDEIGKSPNYPKSYRFWFERMQTIVQPHQEDSIRAGEAVDKTCLILEPYDATLHSVDDEVLSLWLSKKDKDPLVPIVEVIKTLFAVYKPTTQDIQELNIINGGVSHFLANISKNRQQQGKVSMEDFKLFLKFFGPARECLNKVLNVYKETYFHGFARHSDAAKLLHAKPGSFLVRYSESQLKDGFFAFNVNKGMTSDSRDVIENYSLRYDADIQAFIFRGKRYKTLHEFVADSEYSKILKRGLPKTTTETIKESKYEDETHFLSSGGNPTDFRMLDG